MAPVTASQRYQSEHRLRSWFKGLALLLVVLIGVIPIALGFIAMLRFSGSATPYFPEEVEHFKYGSIGAETASGLPYWLWQALPHLYPQAFDGKKDYSSFGFLYEKDEAGIQKDLPIGISRRQRTGVDLVWFNCAVCHTGAYKDNATDKFIPVPGMPASQLDLHGFVEFLLGLAADPGLGPDKVLAGIEQAGGDFDWIDRLAWRFVVMPEVREQLIIRSSALIEILQNQPAWGRGRVDTFNPYKLVQLGQPYASLDESELFGASDFPSIFLQGPREGMQLHWDGNNDSLLERNLSAALGAGVTPETVDIESIMRVADWLQELEPPAYPYRNITSNESDVESGCRIYQDNCADCHGYRDEDGYVFKGSKLGKVEPLQSVATDPARLDSYTKAFSKQQLNFFAGTPYQFSHFKKTNGYANSPLDGLWLRGPYLHNGSVPSLSALLMPPDQRPTSFLRGSMVLDQKNGGFEASACNQQVEKGYTCYDVRERGNGNAGHVWGTDLEPGQKEQLVACLLTF